MSNKFTCVFLLALLYKYQVYISFLMTFQFDFEFKSFIKFLVETFFFYLLYFVLLAII